MKIDRRIFLVLILVIAFIINFYNFEYLEESETLNFMGDFYIQLLKGDGNFSLIPGRQSIPFIIVPFLVLMGPSLFAIRFAQSFFLVAAILVNYFFARKFFNERVAIISTIVLTLIPLYILNKYAENPLNPIFSTILLYLLYSYYKKPDIRYLAIFSFLTGLAIVFSLIFIYFLLALLFSLILVNFIFKLKVVKKIKIKYLTVFFVFFIIGFVPYILDNNYKHFLQESTITRIMQDNSMILNNYFTRLQHLMLLTSENYYDKVYVEDFFDGKGFSFLNFPLLIISIIYLLKLRKPKGYFLISIVFLFLFFSTFVDPNTTTRVVVHLLILVPVLAIIIGKFFDFLIKKKLYVGISLLTLFVIVNSFFIVYTILRYNYVSDLTYFHYGLRTLSNDKNDVYVVHIVRDNTRLVPDYGIFYFSTLGKVPKSLCEDMVNCGIREKIMNMKKGTKILFDSYTINKIHLEDEIRKMEDEGIITLFFNIRYGRNEVIAHIYEKT